VAATATVATLALAVAASAFGPWVPLLFVENLSSRSAGLLQRAGTALPLGYAFAAGMVAAVNPCGFVLLPAWLGAYLSDRTAAGAKHAIRHSIAVALSVTGGVISLFLVVGAAVAGLSSVLIPAFPWIGLGLGVLLTGAGAFVLAGRTFSLSFLEGLAARLGLRARAPSTRSYATYGVVYGLASLSCTLPAFLAVIVTSLLSGGYLAALLQFLLFGAGMAAVLAAMTVVVGFVTRRPHRVLDAFSRYAPRLSGLLLLLAGGYLVYYWLSVWPLLRPPS